MSYRPESISSRHFARALFGPGDVLLLRGTGLRDDDEPLAPEGLDVEQGSELRGGEELAGYPALEELAEIGPQPPSGGAQGEPQGGGRLALAVAGIDLDESLESFRHGLHAEL